MADLLTMRLVDQSLKCKSLSLWPFKLNLEVEGGKRKYNDLLQNGAPRTWVKQEFKLEKRKMGSVTGSIDIKATKIYLEILRKNTEDYKALKVFV